MDNEKVMEENKKEEKEEDPPPPPTIYDFTQNTTFHGVKYVFEKTHTLRRLAWLVCVLAACSVFLWQVGQRTYDYYQYATNVDVQIRYTKKMPFPAVTMCNQNNYRTSVTAERDLYFFIDDMYSTENVTEEVAKKYSLVDVQTEEFMKAAAHQITDFIDSCTFDGEPCNIEEDFVTTLTDLGVCYTFNSGTKKPAIEVSEAGAAYGLVLILNVEQYEYMKGPQNDAGIKLLMHDQGEVPLVKELGFAVAPGSHTLAGIERTVSHAMGPPYGECNKTDTVPLSNCIVNCRKKYVQKQCDCYDVFMANHSQASKGLSSSNVSGAAQVCDVTTQFICARQQAMEATRDHSCDCKQLCNYQQYAPSLSYAILSKFNIDRIVLNDPVRRKEVERKFLLARELSQRRVHDLAQRDEEKLGMIRRAVDTLWQDIQQVNPAMQDDFNFSEHYHIVSIIEEGEPLIREDIYSILHSAGWLKKLNEMRKIDLDLLPKFLQALTENFLQLGGFATKVQSCVFTPGLFPLPNDYGDVHQYFRDNPQNRRRRKKRSHLPESQVSKDFYFGDARIYKLLHNLDDCGYYLALKQEMAKDLIERHRDLEVDEYHAKVLHDTMKEFFEMAFNDTFSSPYDFPKYQPCKDLLDRMNGPLFDDIASIVGGLTLFSEATDVTSLMAALQHIVTSLGNADIEGIDFAGVCMWPYTDYLGYGGIDNTKALNSKRDFENVYSNYPTVKVSFSNLAEYTMQIYAEMADNVVPAMEIIDQYLEGTKTKMEMAEVFNSVSLKKAMANLNYASNDFISFAREFDQGLKRLIFHLSSGYHEIFTLNFPMVNHKLFWELAFVQYANSSGVEPIQDILATFYDNATLASIIAGMIHHFESDYTNIIAELKRRIPAEITEMIESIEIMQDELREYAEDNKMDQSFFMDNFAQLDIFYQSMTFTEITVQNAFPFISLLSEFGGFMGLLLGASCMTLMEIMDHFITVAWRKCRKPPPSKSQVPRAPAGKGPEKQPINQPMNKQMNQQMKAPVKTAWPQPPKYPSQPAEKPLKYPAQPAEKPPKYPAQPAEKPPKYPAQPAEKPPKYPAQSAEKPPKNAGQPDGKPGKPSLKQPVPHHLRYPSSVVPPPVKTESWM